MTIGGGCRRSLLVDVWGSGKPGGIIVVVNREKKKNLPIPGGW